MLYTSEGSKGGVEEGGIWEISPNIVEYILSKGFATPVEIIISAKYY